MLVLSNLDGRPYDPNDPEVRGCLRKAKCYVDRTVDPPVVRTIKDDSKYEIVGWVWLTNYGELKVNGVDVTKGEGGRYFVYKEKRFPPGVYYLVRKDSREMLVSEKTLKEYFSHDSEDETGDADPAPKRVTFGTTPLMFSNLSEETLRKAYEGLKGKRFKLGAFLSDLGEDYAKAILRWAEGRGSVKRETVNDEEYIAFT
jgi:hypothetical protein